jgi:hypothetical protein
LQFYDNDEEMFEIYFETVKVKNWNKIELFDCWPCWAPNLIITKTTKCIFNDVGFRLARQFSSVSMIRRVFICFLAFLISSEGARRAFSSCSVKSSFKSIARNLSCSIDNRNQHFKTLNFQVFTLRPLVNVKVEFFIHIVTQIDGSDVFRWTITWRFQRMENQCRRSLAPKTLIFATFSMDPPQIHWSRDFSIEEAKAWWKQSILAHMKYKTNLNSRRTNFFFEGTNRITEHHTPKFNFALQKSKWSCQKHNEVLRQFRREYLRVHVWNYHCSEKLIEHIRPDLLSFRNLRVRSIDS